MKISIVISVYNSHKAFERQNKYWESLELPDDIEIIIADDGSNPPLKSDIARVYKTNSKLAWTQGLGRNLGASKATGEYLLMTDIDHIITQEALEASYNFEGPMMRFRRNFGILDKEGKLKTDLGTLKTYGLAERYYKNRDVNLHRNTFLIKRSIFSEIGGYNESWCKLGFHPQTRRGEDCYFDMVWRKYAKSHGLNVWPEIGPSIYVFPNGRFHKDRNTNPYNLFHNLDFDKQESFNK